MKRSIVLVSLLLAGVLLSGCAEDDGQIFDLSRLTPAHRLDFLAAAEVVNAAHGLHIAEGPGPSWAEYFPLPWPQHSLMTWYPDRQSIAGIPVHDGGTTYKLQVRTDVLCPGDTYQPTFAHELRHIVYHFEGPENPPSGCTGTHGP